MKSVVTAILAVSLIACNSTQTRKNTDLIQQNLKGKVQTLEERTTNFDSSGKAKSDSTISISGFNAEGYNTTYTAKDSSGKITVSQTISHNPDGTTSEVKATKDGKQTFRVTIETDGKGNYTTAKSYDSTDKQDSYYTDLKTNEYGITYAGKQYFMGGKIKSTFDMKYEGPNFVGGVATDSTGKPSYQGTVKLNEKGDAIEEHYTTHEKDSTITKNPTYKYDSYDDKGNWTQRTTTDDKGKKTTVVKRTLTYYKD